MNPRKYMIENAVAMRAGFRVMLQQQDFENQDTINSLKETPCHIYMICRRPRFSFNHENIIITPSTVKGSFFINKGDHREEHSYETPNKAELCMHSYSIKKPYTEIDFYNKEGLCVSGGRASLLYTRLFPQYNESLDLEVLYVGQAFGEDGNRIAIDRLQSHSTLQKIYCDTLNLCPDKEIWLILWQFEPYVISIAGGFGKAVNGIDESIEHYNTVVNSTISLDQQITITEAALIKYFQPNYNKEYKTSFPSSSHSSYDQCYKLDINCVAFELDTVCLKTRLFSDNVKPSIIHTNHFPLYSEIERKDMFYMLK